MASQTTGYYTSRKEPLLRDFDSSCASVHASLAARYGEKLANALENDARHEYGGLIPEIPHIRGPRAGALNTFLLISAQELAAYKALTKYGKSPGEAWEVCHQALRTRLASFPRWRRWLIRRFMFSRLVRRIVAWRARSRQRLSFGDFEIEFVVGETDDFDFGVNYLQCGIHRFVKDQDGGDFAPFVCMSDIALSEAMGWNLHRTQTLADGCAHCDFRFKRGAVTQISSMTREVQETIERIRERENQVRAQSPVRPAILQSKGVSS